MLLGAEQMRRAEWCGMRVAAAEGRGRCSLDFGRDNALFSGMSSCVGLRRRHGKASCRSEGSFPDEDFVPVAPPDAAEHGTSRVIIGAHTFCFKMYRER